MTTTTPKPVRWITTTRTGKVIRGGDGWSRRVTDYLMRDETLVKLASVMIGTKHATDPDGWRAARLAVEDRIRELVDLPNDAYVSVKVSCVCDRIRRMS